MFVFFIRNTLLTVDSECFLRSGWSFDCYLSGVETNKNGVAILFNNTFEYKTFEVFRDTLEVILDVEVLKNGSYIRC